MTGMKRFSIEKRSSWVKIPGFPGQFRGFSPQDCESHESDEKRVVWARIGPIQADFLIRMK
jgi:hypothetical protein